MINWDEIPLGKESDSSIAKRLGTLPGAVRRARRCRGIPPYSGYVDCRSKGIDWDNQPLGKMTDVELARKLDVNSSNVCVQRRKRGIPPFCSSGRLGIDWDLVFEHNGHLSNLELSRILGVSEQTVISVRDSRDLCKYGIDWDNQPLGKVSDIELSKRLNCTRNQVYSARKARGIEPFCKQGYPNKDYQDRVESIDWENVGLGDRSDYAIGHDLGVSSETVRKKRIKMGIGPYDQHSNNV